MLAHQFRVLEKSRQSLSTLLAFEQINAHKRLLPQVYYHPVVAAAVSSWNPALLKTTLAVLLDNAHTHSPEGGDFSRLSAERHALTSLTKYAQQFRGEAWWRDVLHSVLSDAPELVRSSQRRRLLRHLLAPEKHAEEATTGELLAEKKLGLDLSAVSLYESLLRSHHRPDTFSSLLNEEKALEDTEKLCATMQSLLSTQKPLENEKDVELVDFSASIAKLKEQQPEYCPSKCTSFFSTQKALQKLMPNLARVESASSLDSFMSSLRRWQSAPASASPRYHEQMQSLALAAMHWYMQRNPPAFQRDSETGKSRRVFDVAAFVAFFRDFEHVLPAFFRTHRSFARAVLQNVDSAQREAFTREMQRLGESLSQLSEKEDRVRLATQLLATSVVLHDASLPLSKLLLLCNKALSPEEVKAAVAQAVVAEHGSHSVLQLLGSELAKHAVLDGALMKNNANNNATITPTASVTDLLTQRRNVFSFVQTFTHQRQQQGSKIENNLVSLLVSHILCHHAQDARSMLEMGLYQPHRIIEAICIESSWNQDAPFPFHHLSTLLRLCSKSYSEFTESADKRTVITFVDRILLNWEATLLYDEKQKPLLAEIVKFYCMAGQIDRAQYLLAKSNCNDGTAFEPIVYYWACVKKNMDEAKLVLSQLMATNRAPTQKMLDALVLGYRENGQRAEALDQAVDFFHQHRVAPSLRALEDLRKVALEQQDQHEVKRIDYMRLHVFKM